MENPLLVAHHASVLVLGSVVIEVRLAHNVSFPVAQKDYACGVRHRRRFVRCIPKICHDYVERSCQIAGAYHVTVCGVPTCHTLVLVGLVITGSHTSRSPNEEACVREIKYNIAKTSIVVICSYRLKERRVRSKLEAYCQ